MTHICPRRSEGFGRLSDPAVTGPDEYLSSHGLVGQPRGCSYCGSMSPEDFLEAVRAGAEIGPTDKSYKLYVEGMPSPEPDRLWCTSTSNHPTAGFAPYKDLNREQKKAVRRDYGRDVKGRYFGGFMTRPMVSGKFYTQHFSEEQGWEFDRLWKAHEINWGYPGAPYVPLFVPGPSTQEKTK